MIRIFLKKWIHWLDECKDEYSQNDWLINRCQITGWMQASKWCWIWRIESGNSSEKTCQSWKIRKLYRLEIK